MTRAGILSDDEDRFGQLEIVERDCAFADADCFRKRAARRLVAHVRAVGQVVRAELAYEELIKKGCLVRRAPRSVERGLVGRSERVKFVGDELESIAPFNGFV